MSASRVDAAGGSKRPGAGRILGRIGTYAGLIFWAVICIFPLYWTVTTSIKPKEAVLQGPKIVPWLDFQPDE